MSGARAALDYFHVPDAENRVAEYARLKQEMVVRLIQAGDFTAYPDALRFSSRFPGGTRRSDSISAASNIASFRQAARCNGRSSLGARLRCQTASVSLSRKERSTSYDNATHY